MKKPLLLLIMSGVGMLCLRSQTMEASYGNSFAEDMPTIYLHAHRWQGAGSG